MVVDIRGFRQTYILCSNFSVTFGHNTYNHSPRSRKRS